MEVGYAISQYRKHCCSFLPLLEVNVLGITYLLVKLLEEL